MIKSDFKVEMFGRGQKRGRAVFLVLALVWSLFFGPGVQTAAAGEQTVQVTDRDEQSGLTPKQRAMSQAVLQEARQVLPRPLQSSRKEVVADFLRSRAQNLVLSYTQLEGSVWQIRVNTNELISLIKGMGLYYTLDRSLAYELSFPAATPSTLQQVQELEVLSGLTQTRDQTPRLDLEPKQSGPGWQATLHTSSQTWSATDKDLDGVWVDIWSKYFGQPELIQAFVRTVRLSIAGWSSTSGVQGFDTHLGHWPRVVDSSRLLQIVFTPGGIEGTWRLTTLDQESLSDRLQAFATARGLTWKVGPIVDSSDTTPSVQNGTVSSLGKKEEVGPE